MSDNWCHNCGNPINNDSDFCSDACKLELENEKELERIETEKECSEIKAGDDISLCPYCAVMTKTIKKKCGKCKKVK